MSFLPGLTCFVLLFTAYSAGADCLVLKKDVELRGSAVAGAAGPMFLMANQIESTQPNVIVASGNVEARQAGQNFFADWLLYDTTRSFVDARGRVRMEQPTLLISGDTLKFNLNDYSGELTQPVYSFPLQQGRGKADHIEFVDVNNATLTNATYTTCPVGNEDWYLKVGELDIDKSREVGTAYNATLRFLGVPILYTPWINFPLSDARKTGILAPTFGTTERSGIDIMVPYYLNLAPNYDATLYPRLLSKRGVQLGGEFRYLLSEAGGVNRLEYLPNDNALGLTLEHSAQQHLSHQPQHPGRHAVQPCV